jgi:hypothetical protein
MRCQTRGIVHKCSKWIQFSYHSLPSITQTNERPIHWMTQCTIGSSFVPSTIIVIIMTKMNTQSCKFVSDLAQLSLNDLSFSNAHTHTIVHTSYITHLFFLRLLLFLLFDSVCTRASVIERMWQLTALQDSYKLFFFIHSILYYRKLILMFF